jgi:hypothetical protein
MFHYFVQLRIATQPPLPSNTMFSNEITDYLAHQKLINTYLEESNSQFQQLQKLCQKQSPLLYQKLRAAQVQKDSAA